MDKDLSAHAGRYGRGSHADQHGVPVCGEGVVGEGLALVVHKHMGLPFCSIVICEQVVAMDMQLGELGKWLWQGEADGCPPPRLLILVVWQVDAETWLLGAA